MKKQLSILAGSILLASSAQAAITAGDNDTDSSAILVLMGSNGSFVIETGVSAGDLAAGTGFSVSIAGAVGAGALADITGYALFGALGQDTAGLPLGYANAGLGYVAAGGATVSTEGALASDVNAINSYIGLVSGGGFFGAGLGVLTNNVFASALSLVQAPGAVTQLFTGTEQGDQSVAVSGPITITGPNGVQEGAYIDGSTFNVTAEQVTNPIPVPAAVWLFGSALVGLGVVRRKK